MPKRERAQCPARKLTQEQLAFASKIDLIYLGGIELGGIERGSSTLVSARMAAAVYGLNDRLEFASGHELDEESALKVPTDILGRLLDDRELRKLSRVLVGPKKPPGPSLWRPKAARRVGKQ